MCDSRNEPIEKVQHQPTKIDYYSPRLVEYGSLVNLTKGMSGSNADGQGSQGPGNQGFGS
jgi:hypothetical protein